MCVCVCVCVEPEPYIAPVVEVLVIFASTNHVICVVGFVLLLLLLLLANRSRDTAARQKNTHSTDARDALHAFSLDSDVSCTRDGI